MEPPVEIDETKLPGGPILQGERQWARLEKTRPDSLGYMDASRHTSEWARTWLEEWLGICWKSRDVLYDM
ncbi:hypothetical protein MTO96_025588 [Rhipicephalus appendiculatus]